MTTGERKSYWLAAGLVWGTLFGLMIAAFFYLGSSGADALWCSIDEKGSCFREWVSALGGWAAVAAAVPTVYYLSRQIRAAATYEKVNFALTVRSNLALASSARHTAMQVRYQLQSVRETLANSSLPRLQQVTYILAVCKLSAECFRRPTFVEYEARIGVVDAATVGTISIYLDQQIANMEMMTEGILNTLTDAEFDSMLNGLHQVMNTANKFAENICVNADAFFEDMNNLGLRLS